MAQKVVNKETQCVERVFPDDRWGSFQGYRCTFAGKVQREGKWYCNRHDPEARQARNDAKYNQYKQKIDESIAKAKLDAMKLRTWQDLAEACNSLCAWAYAMVNPSTLPQCYHDAMKILTESGQYE